MLSPSLQTGQPGGFAREVKFVISPSTAAEIHRWASVWLSPDPNGDSYRVTSLYFDTERFDVLNSNGSFARGKYRVRRYGSSEGVFLERKLKTAARVGKKRTQVALVDLPRIEQPEPDPGWSGYWYHRRILARRLRAVCQISYTRIARVAATQGSSIRLTMDSDLTATCVDGLGFSNHEPVRVAVGEVILELKYRQRSELFQQLIERFKLAPQTASKYRTACASLGLGTLQHA